MKTPSFKGVFRRDENGQRILVAVRFIFPPDDTADDGESTSVLSEKSKVVPIPELGCVAINLVNDGTRKIQITSFKPKRQIIIGGLAGRHRADVKDDAGRLVERWFAETVPEGHESFAHFVSIYLKEMAVAQHKPVLVEKSPHETPANIRETTRRGCEQLLRKEYPRMYRAIDDHQSVDVIRKAFIADFWALVGHSPEVQDVERFTSDPAFTRWLSAALAKPGKRDDADWILALGWLSKGFYRMKEPELGAALNKLSGLNLQPSSWTKRASRLGLINASKKGRPTVPFAG